MNKKVLFLYYAINSLLATVIASRYLTTFNAVDVSPVEWLSIFTSLVSHSWLLIGVALTPLCINFGVRFAQAQKLLVASMATLALSLLWVDTTVFEQYRFHLNGFVFQFLWHGQAINFPWSIWFLIGAVMSLIWLSQYQLLSWLSLLTEPKFNQRYQRFKVTFVSLLVLFTLSSHMLNAYASAFHLSHARAFQTYLPLFYPLRANSLLIRLGVVTEDDIAKREIKQRFEGNLNYPSQELHYRGSVQPPHIVLIVVDTLRQDTLNAQVMPRTFAFAQKHQAVFLEHHFSSGNATRLGMFGLFYGLYSTYWPDVLIRQQSPVWLDRMQDLGYQMGVFASAQLRYPEFSQTIFSGIKDLRLETEGKSASLRDQQATQDWFAWFAQREKKQPHFSFLFYDAIHGYDFPDDYPVKFEPMAGEDFVLMRNATADPEPIFNRYRTAAHYVDSLIGRVLERLEQDGELDQTLVMITSDHGEEMNDVQRNYWGHGSSFSDAQTHVPFIMFGAGIEQHATQLKQHKITTHYDVAPTVMQHYLGLTSDVSVMSDGFNMLDASSSSPKWFILGRYGGYGVRTPDHIVDVSKSGYYRVFNSHYQAESIDDLDQELIQEVMPALNRFRKH